jgi:hypothetical protein
MIQKMKGHTKLATTKNRPQTTLKWMILGGLLSVYMSMSKSGRSNMHKSRYLLPDLNRAAHQSAEQSTVADGERTNQFSVFASRALSILRFGD